MQMGCGGSSRTCALAHTHTCTHTQLTISGDVDGVALAELGDLLLDGVPPGALCTRRLGGEVGVAAGAVPVAGDGLGVEGDGDVVELGDAEEDVAAHPEVVAHVDAGAGADLVLPLQGRAGQGRAGQGKGVRAGLRGRESTGGTLVAMMGGQLCSLQLSSQK
jgi:hypothetical protein